MANVVDDRSKGNGGEVSNLLMSLNDDGDKNLVEGAVATGKCVPSYLPAHVSTYADLKAGQVYKQLTICAQLENRSILVQFGAVEKM